MCSLWAMTTSSYQGAKGDEQKYVRHGGGGDFEQSGRKKRSAKLCSPRAWTTSTVLVQKGQQRCVRWDHFTGTGNERTKGDTQKCVWGGGYFQ